jgi:hypothetical protein
MAKKKKVMMKTGTGTFVYPYLSRPDSFKGKEKYKCDIRVPATADKTTALVSKIDELLENQKKLDTIMNGGEELEYVQEYVPYQTDDTSGTVTFRSSLNRKGNIGKPDEFEQRPFVFDSKNNVVPQTTDIWSGSEGELNVELNAWSMEAEGGQKCGVSLRLRAAQVFAVAQRDDRKAEDFGFTAQDGGFDVTQGTFAEEGEGDVDTSEAEDY